MRLCADQPHAREGLRDGSLTLSAAAELQWAFDRQRRRGSISGTAAIAPAGSAAQTDPAADSAPSVPVSSAESQPPPLVLDAVGRQKLVDEAAGKSARQVRQMLANLDPELAPPADRVRPLGDGRYELKATIDAECQQGLEQLRGLLSTWTRACLTFNSCSYIYLFTLGQHTSRCASHSRRRESLPLQAFLHTLRPH